MMRKFWVAFAALTLLTAWLAITDDCRQHGTASFKLNQMFDLRGCK